LGQIAKQAAARSERVPAGSSAYLIQLSPVGGPEELTHGLGLVQGSNRALFPADSYGSPSLNAAYGVMRVISRKSQVRQNSPARICEGGAK
jgi:hypothetical protein